VVGIKTQVTIKEGAIERGFTTIKRLLNSRLRKSVGAANPIIVKAINEGIERSKNRFIPSKADAGELGIGAGGSVDDGKRTNAWRQLLIPEGTGDVTKFTVTRISEERAGVVTEIQITINEDAFFNKEISKISTPDSDEVDEIRWMDWFINGQTIGGHRFSGRARNREVSRTGRGIMIRGGVWVFSPKGQDAFNRTLDEVRRTINKRLKQGIAARILRRFRRAR